MIICALDDQLKQMMKLPSLELDMSYKRVRRNGYNELLSATFLSEHGKSMNLFISLGLVTN